MRVMWRWALGVLILLATTWPALAQSRPALAITLPARDSLALLGPTISAARVFGDKPIRELLDYGFPARLHFRVELWSTAGWFDRSLRSTEWDVVLRYDPVQAMFEAVRVIGDVATPLGMFRTLADAAAEVERPYRPAIAARPRRSDQYYNVVLELEMLSVSDLDELQRWVRGDLSPAVRGDRNPGTALSRGARTLLSRLLGGERRTLEIRSARFAL